MSDNKKDKARRQSMKENQLEGIKEIKASIEEYLGTGDGSKKVREYLYNAKDNEEFILRFLKGRKYRPKHAWETIKRYAEVQFDTYPDLFVGVLPKEILPAFDEEMFGVLKSRDSEGRRIGYFNGNNWDPVKYPLDILMILGVRFMESLLQDEDCMNNGFVFVQECSEMGLKHAKEYTLPNMLRVINIFWYAFPLKLKGVYYMNVPYLLSFVYGIIKPFFPKKLKERFVLSSSGKKFQLLHERISPDILPKCLGGNLEHNEAIDHELHKKFLTRG